MFVTIHMLIQNGYANIAQVVGPFSSREAAEKEIRQSCEGCVVEEVTR